MDRRALHVRCNPQICKQSDAAEVTHTHIHTPYRTFAVQYCVNFCCTTKRISYLLLLFSQQVVSNSLRPHGLEARQASLSFTVSRSLLRLMSIELVMPSNHLILCHPLLLLPSIFPSVRIFSNEWALTSGSQSIVTSASASFFLMNIQS